MEDNKDKHCGDVCTDDRFSMIARVKGELMRSTNIETNKKEMEVIDGILFRFWQLGWLQLIDCEIASKNKHRDYNRYGTVEKIDIGEISKGNFVRSPVDDTPCVVTGIHPDGSVELTRDDGASKLTRFQCHADLLAPIPLTDGILEKTGFHHSMPYNDWTNDTVDLILYDAADGYGVQNTSITIRYVHQFQNLLKQCKTKIEVKL
jgi:hypothetical protein